MFSKTLFVLALAATGALAQSGTETSSAAEPTASLPAGISECIIGCIQPAAEAAGCQFTDPSCVCNSQQFQSQATECLNSQCSAEDVQAALALQAQQCGTVNTSASGSVTGSATTAASSEAPSAPATSSAATSNTALTSSRATSTTPNSASTSRSVTSSASSPAATTGNAAVGTKGSMGLVGLMVAGVFGLVL